MRTTLRAEPGPPSVWGPGLSPRGRRSGDDREAIDDVNDTGSVPRRALGFLPRRPRRGHTVQVDGRAAVRNRDQRVVHDGVPLERLLDAVRDITRDGIAR